MDCLGGQAGLGKGGVNRAGLSVGCRLRGKGPQGGEC